MMMMMITSRNMCNVSVKAIVVRRSLRSKKKSLRCRTLLFFLDQVLALTQENAVELRTVDVG